MRRQAQRRGNEAGGFDDVGEALGAADRRVHGDLERFKELVEAGGSDDGWRGEVKRPDES